MKFKDLDAALKYSRHILNEEDRPIYQVTESTTDDELAKIEELDDLAMETHCIICEGSELRQELRQFKGYLVVDCSGHSRRGQYYHYLVSKETLEIYVFATKADGSGGKSILPNLLFDLIKKGDIVV